MNTAWDLNWLSVEKFSSGYGLTDTETKYVVLRRTGNDLDACTMKLGMSQDALDRLSFDIYAKVHVALMRALIQLTVQDMAPEHVVDVLRGYRDQTLTPIPDFDETGPVVAYTYRAHLSDGIMKVLKHYRTPDKIAQDFAISHGEALHLMQKVFTRGSLATWEMESFRTDAEGGEFDFVVAPRDEDGHLIPEGETVVLFAED